MPLLTRTPPPAFIPRPARYVSEVQVTVTAHAADGVHDPTIAAVNAASCALLLSRQVRLCALLRAPHQPLSGLCSTTVCHICAAATCLGTFVSHIAFSRPGALPHPTFVRPLQPWQGPVGCVRIGLVDGVLTVNPTVDALATSTLDLVYAGTASRPVMLETVADQVRPLSTHLAPI